MKARSASTRPSISPESRSITATESAEAERSGIFAATNSLRRGSSRPPARRSSPAPTSRSARSRQLGPEDLVVLVGERQLVGGGDQVAGGDLLAFVVEDRRLDRAVDELVGVAAEELVEGVLAGDVDGEAAAAAPGPPPHLAQAGDGAGEGDADRRVELADVDAELERVGRDHRQQLAGASRASISRRCCGV